jgi:hypothetical protein
MSESARKTLALTMALLLILTGQGVAMARGTPGASGRMVVCTGAGLVIIDRDASGHPTGPAHFCPDRALVLLAAVALAPPRRRVPAPIMRVKPAALALSFLPGHARLTSARDPPGTV